MSVFKNKVVLITGAAAGIGRALAEEFVSQGSIVYATDINLDALSESSNTLTPLRLDVSNEQDFEQAIQKIVREHQRLDIMINNAGVGLAGDFNGTSMADIKKITAINYWSAIYGSKHAYAQMVKQGHGHLVNVSSSGGMMPVPMQTMYCATKHAVLGFSHSLREEAVHHGVKVSVVLPGMVKSKMWESAVNVGDYNLQTSMKNTGLEPITAKAAASAIVKGIAANDRSIVFPRINKIVLCLYRLMPSLMTRLAVAPLANPNNS